MKTYVLFYKVRTKWNSKDIELSGYRYFLYKKDLANFMNKQGAEFLPLAIQRLDTSNTILVDKSWEIVKLKGGK